MANFQHFICSDVSRVNPRVLRLRRRHRCTSKPWIGFDCPINHLHAIQPTVMLNAIAPFRMLKWKPCVENGIRCANFQFAQALAFLTSHNNAVAMWQMRVPFLHGANRHFNKCLECCACTLTNTHTKSKYTDAKHMREYTDDKHMRTQTTKATTTTSICAHKL